MLELYRFDTIMDMLDPINESYRCIMYPAEVVKGFPKGAKTRVLVVIDDKLHLQCGLQSNGDGRYFSMIGKGRLEGYTYEFGQKISVVVYEDPNPLGVEIPETLEALLEQDEIAERVWSKLTDGRKRTLCHNLHRTKNLDLQIEKALRFLELEQEKLVERGKW